MCKSTLYIAALLFLLFSSFNAYSQQIDYSKEFPMSYTIAVQYVARHQGTTENMRNNGIDPALGWSIVFPELIRYDAIQDFFEVSALQTLYIQFGDSYADFSIGEFQIKPSFAMQLQKQWMHIQPKLFGLPPLVFDTTNTPDARRAIVSQLNSDQGQLMYLILFIKIMDVKNWVFLSNEAKVRCYATAYNSSFEYSRKTIERLSDERNFHTGITRALSSTLYSYSDIAVDFYKKFGVAFQK